MSFEQFQEEDGKNIINITIGKNNNEIPNKNIENFIDQAFLPNALEEQVKKTSASLIIDELKKIEMNSVSNKNSNELKSDSTKNYIETKKDIVEVKDEYVKKEYYTLSGIIFAWILFFILLILYQKGF